MSGNAAWPGPGLRPENTAVEVYDMVVYVVYLDDTKTFDIVLCDSQELAELAIKTFARKVYCAIKLKGGTLEVPSNVELSDFLEQKKIITTAIFERFITCREDKEEELDADVEVVESCNQPMGVEADPCV